jgi:formamidopyrimidine-DNA glycosylase
LSARLQGRLIQRLTRRGKYLLIHLDQGTLIAHLGMSGSFRMIDPEVTPRKHDHYDLLLSDQGCLRFHDPRRFGCLLMAEHHHPWVEHPLLKGLGPEPLSDQFSGDHLYGVSRGRTAAIKSFIMDSRIVVGVGNIYASEALFRAGIHPLRAAGKVSSRRYTQLAEDIQKVLQAAIEQGGTTLRDFVNESGHPGYFKQTLNVYDRAGEPCRLCGQPIRLARIQQRATYWCGRCQH